MALQTPSPSAPERILAYGAEGTFKTANILSIARRCLQSDQTAWVVDTDGALPIFVTEADDLAMREDWVDGEDYGDGEGQFVRYSANDWVTWRDAVTDMFERATRGDWICLDTATWPWGDVQEWYLKEVHGQDLNVVLLDHRADQLKKNKGNDAGAGAVLGEWPYINSVWNDTWRRPLMRATQRGLHVYMAAHSKSINPERDKDEIKSTYGKVRAKPDGQNKLGKDARTILYLEQDRTRTRRMTTVKDWAREEERSLDGDVLEDFAVDYLFKIAKWRPKKEG